MWYRGIAPRPEIHINKKYVDYEKIFNNFGLKTVLDFIINEKEVKIFTKGGVVMKEIKDQLAKEGYDFAIAIATEAEIKAQSACGQLSIIVESEEDRV